MFCSVMVALLLTLAQPSMGLRMRRGSKHRQVGRQAHAAGPVRVATLAGHDGGAWNGACRNTQATSLERALCNLDLYAEAVRTAGGAAADLLVLPEYGLTAGGSSAHADAVPSVGDSPCGLEGTKHAQVSRLACLARQYSVALVSCLITSDRSGNKYITQVVFDKGGQVLAVYHKFDLFPGEGWAKKGDFNPTVFELFGQKWALAICYEGIAPHIPFFGSWKQFDAFREQGAENILWSVGNTAIGSMLTGSARQLATRFHMNVFATMNEAMIFGDTTALIDAEGTDLPRSGAPLDGQALSALGYKKAPRIDIATV